MKEYIFLIYEFLTAFVPFLAVFVWFRHLHRKRGKRISAIYHIATILFAVYIIAVFYVTGSGTFYEGMRRQFEINWMEVNMVPFSNDIDLRGYLLNILMFVPFGFLVPFIWRKRDRFMRVLFSGFLFSLLIEVSQLFNNRATDVDDLIMNTVGAIVGFGLFKLFAAIVNYRPKHQPRALSELPVYILVMFVGHFMLFDGLWMVNCTPCQGHFEFV